MCEFPCHLARFPPSKESSRFSPITPHESTFLVGSGREYRVSSEYPFSKTPRQIKEVDEGLQVCVIPPPSSLPTRSHGAARQGEREGQEEEGTAHGEKRLGQVIDA